MLKSVHPVRHLPWLLDALEGGRSEDSHLEISLTTSPQDGPAARKDGPRDLAKLAQCLRRTWTPERRVRLRPRLWAMTSRAKASDHTWAPKVHPAFAHPRPRVRYLSSRGGASILAPPSCRKPRATSKSKVRRFIRTWSSGKAKKPQSLCDSPQFATQRKSRNEEEKGRRGSPKREE